MKKLKTVGDYQRFAQFLDAGGFPPGMSIADARLHWASMPMSRRAQLSRQYPGVCQFLAPQTFPLERDEYEALLMKLAKELGCSTTNISVLGQWWTEAGSDTQVRFGPEFNLVIDVLEGRIPPPYVRPLPTRIADADAA